MSAIESSHRKVAFCMQEKKKDCVLSTQCSSLLEKDGLLVYRAAWMNLSVIDKGKKSRRYTLKSRNCKLTCNNRRSVAPCRLGGGGSPKDQEGSFV